jgi:MFS family permease
MINVALAFAVLDVDGSASAVGLVFALRTAPMVAALLVGGVVADRTSRRAVMVTADLVRVASQGTIAVLLVAGTAEVWSLGVLAGLTGVATGFYMPAATGLLPAVVGPDELQRANGARFTAMAGGEILGPLAAGALVVAASPGWAIGIDAATFAVSAALLSRLRLSAEPPVGRTTFLGDLGAGWREFRARTWVWVVVLASAAENAFWGAWSALGPVVADRELGGAGAWGTVLAAMGAGGVAGGLVAMRWRPGRPAVAFALSGVVFAVPLALVAVPAPVAVLAAGAFVGGVALMFGNALWESTLQSHIPREALSRVSSYEWFGSNAVRPLGLALWGPVAVAIGLGSALWLAAALFAATSLSLLAVPSVRGLRTAQATT